MAESPKEDVPPRTELYEEASKINALAHYARIQAHEVELKARHAMNLAERAMCEAESVREVAESLTCTAHAVAKMAFEFTQNRKVTNEYLREQMLDQLFINSSQKATPRTPPSGFTKGHTSDYEKRLQEDFPTSKSPKRNGTGKGGESSSCGLMISNTPIHTPVPQNSPVKYTETFPTSSSDSKEALPKEIDSSHSLPIVWENSYQGARESKPVSWTEKKSLRKIQRKLRNLENDMEEADMDGENSHLQFQDDPMATQNDMDEMKISPVSKEKLLQSVRFSETKTDNMKRTAF